MTISAFTPLGPRPMITPAAPIGRIPVQGVQPVVEGGRWAAKAVVGEMVPIRATVFRDGHDHVSATAVLIDPHGHEHRSTMMLADPGFDVWQGHVAPDVEGRWEFRVEGWSNPYATWASDASVKVDAGVDVEIMLAEGAILLQRAAAAPGLAAAEKSTLLDGATGLTDSSRPAQARLAAGLNTSVEAVLADHPVRDFLTASATYPLRVHRAKALFASWYEFFPRSEGAQFDEATGTWVSGTFATAATRLPGIAAMGFDTVYLTPIHPIGTTHRKGRNNTLSAQPGDPGSPYGIGSAAGGHDAIHPDLGSHDDFSAFVDTAHDLGLEVALDLALQTSPDHPWVSQHPDWFTTRADGSIAHAENPPKKYEDIYPVNFDNDPEGIYAEVRRLLQVWIDLGVTAFRVDNPHTKPLTFWERLLADVDRDHPEVLFLSEAFTKPAMMKALAMIGFHQSYTYFTWRNTKTDVIEYLAEVSSDQAAIMRPSFWPTTHDILTPYMQQGGVPAFKIRAVLAATGSPLWGIYSGYEFAESVARPGAEEHIDNEKYEFKPRDWGAVHEIGISPLLTSLNTIRREHPSLQQLRNLTVQETSNEAVVAFSKHLPGRFHPRGEAETVIIVLTLDPFTVRESMVYLDMVSLGLPDDAAFEARDLLSGETYTWGREAFVQLDPRGTFAHIIKVRPIGGTSWLT